MLCVSLQSLRQSGSETFWYGSGSLCPCPDFPNPDLDPSLNLKNSWMNFYSDCLLCVTSLNFCNNFSCYLSVVLWCSFIWNWAQNIGHLSRVLKLGEGSGSETYFFGSGKLKRVWIQNTGFRVSLHRSTYGESLYVCSSRVSLNDPRASHHDSRLNLNGFSESVCLQGEHLQLFGESLFQKVESPLSMATWWASMSAEWTLTALWGILKGWVSKTTGLASGLQG